MDDVRRIEINTPALTRVEGEGSLELSIADNRIEALRLRIFEPPRFFEKFLEGRDHQEVPDITARICGICPVAYQMSSVGALERLFGVEVSPWIKRMRRIMYCGEWIQSHALHIHLLALPDYLGFNDALSMGKEHPEILSRGLKLQSLGNQVIRVFGGRSVHPVGVRVGGFHKAPGTSEVSALAAKLESAIADTEELALWIAGLNMPGVEQDTLWVSLRHDDEYPMIADRIIVSDNNEFGIDDFHRHIHESHLPHSTALHASYHGKPYLVGPLARLNLNLDRLPGATLALMQQAGIPFPSNNLYHSMLARALEIHIALLDAVKLLREYAAPKIPWQDYRPRAGTGSAATEAPRGLLWHRYSADDEGLIRSATIVPPTSQNQSQIEADIARTLTTLGLDQSADRLRFEAERVIRNYDPCISCATHFLRLDMQRK